MIYNPHAHHPSCASLVWLLSAPPQTRPCDCGLNARNQRIADAITKNSGASAAPTDETAA